MPLYNCKPEGDSHRITKFDSDFNVESSYLTNGRECECPAGHRPTCRHRQMLPRFLAKGAGTGQWFHNFEAKSWVRAEADVEFEPETLGDLASAASQVEVTPQMVEDAVDYIDRNPSLAAPQPINLLALATPPKPLRRL